MIRRINFTDRIKITKEKVTISLHSKGDLKWFDASIDIDDLGFPDDASVFVEARYKGLRQRFSYGTVGNITPPSDTVITDIPNTEFFYFDVYITGKRGRILGIAKSITLGTETTNIDRLPLLPVNFIDMGNEFWRVGFDSTDDGRPIIEINKSIPEISAIAHSDVMFKCLVYSAAVRIILREYLRFVNSDQENEEDSWLKQWNEFISKTLNIKYRPHANTDTDFLSEDQEQWITMCVDEFCRIYNLKEKFIMSSKTAIA